MSLSSNKINTFGPVVLLLLALHRMVLLQKMFPSIAGVTCPRFTASAVQPQKFGGTEGVSDALLCENGCMQEITCRFFVGVTKKKCVRQGKVNRCLLVLAFSAYLSQSNTSLNQITKFCFGCLNVRSL